MPDQSVYIIGGAKDQTTKETLKTVTQYKICAGGKVSVQEVAPMISSRSSFGCIVNVHTN